MQQSIHKKFSQLHNAMTSESKTLKEEILEKRQVTINNQPLENGVDRLTHNHSINKKAVGTEIMRQSKSTYLKSIEKLIEDGVIDRPYEFNRSHMFSLTDIYKIKDYYNHEKYRDNYNPKVITISNLKGGTAKSTSALTLAVAAAKDLELNANVLIIDLDPQGTVAQSLVKIPEGKENEEIYVTTADILLVDDEPDGTVAELIHTHQLTLEDIILSAPFNTHLPKLDVMTAFPFDERFVDYYWEKENQEQRDALLTKFAQKFIPTLKQKYDLIILDLPPQNSPIVWSALEATEMMLIPVTPRRYDFMSTTRFMKLVDELIETTLPNKAKYLEWVKVLPTNFDDKSKQERDVYESLLRTCGSDLITMPIKHSELFIEAASMNVSIFDIKKSEANTSSQKFDDAIRSATDAYRYLIAQVKTVAAIKK